MTNGPEGLNQNRTCVVRIFPNRAAFLRLVTALCLEQSEEWVSGRRYLDIGAPFPGGQAEHRPHAV